jgi:hypothetical protein
LIYINLRRYFGYIFKLKIILVPVISCDILLISGKKVLNQPLWFARDEKLKKEAPAGTP